MTIEDAIRRAKILGKARLQNDQPEEVRQPAEKTLVRTPREAPLRFDPLQRVEISATACEQNGVLILDSQLRDYPTVDAAYRLLRSRLQNRLKRNNWFSVAIASPSQGDGKSLTAVNVAVSIAREKQKPVYVIDLDMRNPSVCRFLGIRDIRPLPEYFGGQCKPEDVLFETSFPNLIVAGALVPADSPSELLAGPRLGELLSHIRLRSPDAFVVIDLPPVNVTDEALLVGPHVDAFLVIVSEGKTERIQVARTLSSLAEFTVLGVVINQSGDTHVVGYEHYSPS